MSSNIADTVLADLKQFAYDTVLQNHHNEKIANNCANSLMKCLTLNFKGRMMYIPSHSIVDSVREHEAIRREFNGVNHADLAIKYKRSVQNIYTIVKNKNSIKEKRTAVTEVIEDYLPEEWNRYGLERTEAKKLAKKITDHLRQVFPGISVYISTTIYEAWNS